MSGNINADKNFRTGTELTQYTDTNTRTVLNNSASSVYKYDLEYWD